VAQDFRGRHFGAVTIGLQVRLLKCDAGEGSIHCGQLPALEDFAAVAQSLQRARGLADAVVRFFVAADTPETYKKARPLPAACSVPACCQH
jgi:hypothetical protein